MRSSLKDVALAWLPRNSKILETSASHWTLAEVSYRSQHISMCSVLGSGCSQCWVPWAESTWDTQTLAGWWDGMVWTAWDVVKGTSMCSNTEIQGISGPLS